MRPSEEQYQDMMVRVYGGPMPITATLQVTEACNLACTYCYQNNKSPKRMTFETAKKFIDMLLSDEHEYVNSTKHGGVILEFIGGEPFLEIDLIDEVTEYFYERLIALNHPWLTRTRLSICSNGVLYMDPKVQSYIRRNFDNLSFSISVDGNKELHDACRVFPDGRGSYDLAMAGVEHFTKILNGHMGSKMTLAPGNVEHTFEAVKAMVEYGYTLIHLNCVYEKGWTVEHARILYDQLKQAGAWLIDSGKSGDVHLSIFEPRFFCPKDESDLQNWCGGTGKMLAVDPDGRLFPCLRYMESSLASKRPPIVIGHVDYGFCKTEEERSWVKCLECIDRRTQSKPECFDCPIAEGCSWCSAYNYEEFGTPDARATYICVMHIARALANAYFWNRYYLESGEAGCFTIHVPEEWALNIISEEEWAYLRHLEDLAHDKYSPG